VSYVDRIVTGFLTGIVLVGIICTFMWCSTRRKLSEDAEQLKRSARGE
jgi:uncharacterized membrane protein YciS (DUF1049 family)